MIKELKNYLKDYKKSTHKIENLIKKENNNYYHSFRTGLCQHLCGYIYGLINNHFPKSEINYFSIYSHCAYLITVINNKININAIESKIQNNQNIDELLETQVLEIIKDLNLSEFIHKNKNNIFYISNLINETQITKINSKELVNNLTTWILYLILNDRLKNEMVDNEELVTLWISKLTSLTALLTDQLKNILSANFGIILEFISTIVLTLN